MTSINFRENVRKYHYKEICPCQVCKANFPDRYNRCASQDITCRAFRKYIYNGQPNRSMIGIDPIGWEISWNGG
jgi:hypothetical protein